MGDQPYKVTNFIFASKGISARRVDDTLEPGTWLNEDNCEELAENSISCRLGSLILNKNGATASPLSGGAVHSLQKLAGLSGSNWRYAGCGSNLYRITGLNPGSYSLIASNLSGNPWGSAIYRPDISAYPTLFIGDSNQMVKDNGSYSSPEQMGIFQPQYPVSAAVINPDFIVLDNYTGTTSDYTFSGTSSDAIGTDVNTTLSTSIIATGLQFAQVADPTQISLFQLLTIGGAGSETVLVLQVTATGFQTLFTNTHFGGSTVTSKDVNVTVAGSTTATITRSFGSKPIAAWPGTLQQSDYIGLYVYVSDPTQVKSITLKFDCGDGSFNTDYFYKVIAQGPMQSLLDTVNNPTTSSTDVLLAESLGLYGNSSSSIAQLNTGLDVWTGLLIQLSDFAGSGRASFGDPVFNWQAVNAYQIQIVTNQSVSTVTVNVAAMILEGGFGPDVFAGVAYDYLFTYYNANDGAESNPCMSMTNVNPPIVTNWVYPRRQPVVLTLTHPTLDSQVTHARIYRRGGTLGDNYRRVNTVPCSGTTTTYTDSSSDADIQAADIISFTNDVPVTSTLPVPVNTTFAQNLPGVNGKVNSVQTVNITSSANVAVGQQLSIGDPTSILNNFETVIVLAVNTILINQVTAYIQNPHFPGEAVSATAQYGKPVTIMAVAFNQMWFAGDTNNPHYLYYSAASNPQAVSSAAFVEVGTPDDPITCIVPFKGNLYVSTRKFWWAIAPGSNANASPTVYPTAAKHGCIAVNGFLVTEEAIFYEACDGLRAFAGGASTYLTQDLEFIFQGIGISPIVEVSLSNLALTRAAYWNNMLFFSYFGTDNSYHRVILHREYKRWRNDDIGATSLLLEADTNTLVYGDSVGMVHIDRQNVAYDEANSAGAIVQSPIAINLQTPYLDQSAGELQKNYVELQLDVNTNNQNITITLLFNDGQSSLSLGSIHTSQRQKVNLPIQSGNGFQAYKVSLQITGSVSAQVYIYQAAIRWLPLAMTRKSFDSYELKLGTDESKICKQVYIEATTNATVTMNVYYDSSVTAGYTFTIPNTNGVRQSIRFRLPAISFRIIRFIGTSTADWQLWGDSKIEFKPLCAGKGYSVIDFVPN